MSKVVIVTGGSGTLGSEIALRFGLNGNKVVVNYFAHQDRAEAIAQRINEGGGEAFSYKADISNYQQVKAMVEATLDRWDRIDVLVNNAGGYKGSMILESQLATEMEEDEWHKVIDVNLKGPFICIKAVAPQMVKQREGHIINVSSSMAVSGSKSYFAYSAAKAGVISLTKSMARELGDYNIKVNDVWPQPTLSPEAAARDSRISQERRELFRQESLLHRDMGSAREFAEFIVHLSGTENITGQTFGIDSRVVL